MPSHSRRLLVLLTGSALVISLGAASCGDKATGVALGAAARGTVDEIVEAPGSVTARAAATISAPATGTLSELRVEAGSKVRRGQVVAVVDSPAAQSRLDQASEALDQANQAGVPSPSGPSGFTAVQKTTDARADDAFDAARAAAAEVTDPALQKALLAQVDAAAAQYDAASQAAATAVRSLQQGVAGLSQAVGALTAAQRLQAQQAYDLASAAVDALTLHAPVSGVVQLGGTSTAGTSSISDLIAAGATAAPTGGGGAINGVDTAVPEGAAVSAGTPILTIVDTGRLGLAAEVDETDVLLVKAGVTATVELDAATGASYAATVRAVDLLPTTSARGGVSYRVRLDLGKGTYDDGSAAPSPRPGMSAVVRLRVREATDAVTVPASAIVNADGRDTVWVVRAGKAERVPVTVGVQGEDVVQVTTGLDPGQRIVVGGTDQVSAGQELS